MRKLFLSTFLLFTLISCKPSTSNDTIIIQGDIAYPKSDSTQVSNMR